MDETTNDPYAAWIPPQDEAQKLKNAEEQAQISSSIGILDEFFADLDGDIEAYRGLDLIQGVNVATDPRHLLQAALLNNAVRAELLKIRDRYRNKYQQHITEGQPMEQD